MQLPFHDTSICLLSAVSVQPLDSAASTILSHKIGSMEFTGSWDRSAGGYAPLLGMGVIQDLR